MAGHSKNIPKDPARRGVPLAPGARPRYYRMLKNKNFYFYICGQANRIIIVFK